MSQRNQQLDDQEEIQAQRAGANTAVQAAAEQLEEDQQQLIDKLREVGIDGEDGRAIAEEFGADLAGIYALANETEEDYRFHKWTNLNKAERYVADRNPGRLCSGSFLELARGTNNREDQPTEQKYAQRERKKVREAMEAKTAMQSLAKDAEGLSAVAEITAVTEHRRSTEADDKDKSKGLMSRIFG